MIGGLLLEVGWCGVGWPALDDGVLDLRLGVVRVALYVGSILDLVRRLRGMVASLRKVVGR